MDENKKLLSIIVPSYNMEAFLPKCLASLLIPDKKRLGLLDVIVVNDGSSDKTSQIAHDFERRHPGVFRVVDKSNGNYGSCINAALPIAMGTFVKILDADDSFDTVAFARYVGFLDQMSGSLPPDVIINDFVVVDADGTETARHSFGVNGDTSFSLSSIDYKQQCYMWMHAVAYRTELLRSIGYRQTEGISYTDQEWIAIPMMAARRFLRFPGYVYRYLVGRPGQTIDQSVKLKNFSMHLPVMQSIVKALADRRGTIPKETEAYVRELVEAHLRWFYHAYLADHPATLEQNDLVMFDQFLQQTDALLYNSVSDSVVCLVKGRIPFRFVKSWRLHRSRKTFGFLLFDTVMWVRHRWHGIRNHWNHPPSTPQAPRH